MVTDNFPDISFIDNSTIEDVLTQMISDYQNKYKEITNKEAALAKADPHRLIMYACAVQIYQAMQYADYAGKVSFLKYARGEYLDNLVAIRGIQRQQAKPATTTLQFSISEPVASVVGIPAGTRATNGNNVFFATDEYVEIKAGETSVSVSATCTEEGSLGNNFAIGEFGTIVNSLPYVVAVTNTTQTFGGSDIEDDDSLKERAYTIQKSYSTAGPTGAYAYFVKQIDQSISDVVIRSDTPGVVKVIFTTEAGMPDPALIQKVTDSLMDRDIRPLTDKIEVSAPVSKTYDVEFTYYISSGEKASVASIQENIAAAVNSYNAWQTGKIERDINPSYLIQKIMEAGAKRTVIIAPEFTALDNGTIAKTGTVTVKYGGLEDD